MNTIAAQLRSVKNRANAGGFSVEKKAAGKQALLAAIGGEATVVDHAPLQTTYFLWISRTFISRPLVVGVAGFVLAVSGLMTTVSAAEQSLPGDVLYTVKLINERAQLQIASLDRRAVLHTEFAERRLREVEELQSNDATRNSSLVTDTMNAYSQELASANQNLRELQVTGNSATTAAANRVDQNLATLNTTLSTAVAPTLLTDDDAAVTSAQSTLDAAQQDTVSVAVAAQMQEDPTIARQNLEDMFRRQFGTISARKEFDLRRIAVIQSSLEAHADILAPLGIISLEDLDRLERSVNIAVSDVAPAMDAFAAGGYRSAFETLKHADTVLRGIEATIAEAETAITDALMATPVPTDSPQSPQTSSE